MLGLFPEKYVKEIEASATAAGGGGGDALEGDYIAATGGVVPRTTLPATNPFAGTAGASGGTDSMVLKLEHADRWCFAPQMGGGATPHQRLLGSVVKRLRHLIADVCNSE